MAQDVMVSLVGSGTALVVAVGGWIMSWRIAEKGKRVSELEAQVSRLKQECRARIAVEKVACKRIAELEGRTERAAMLDIRSETQQQTGLRPRVTPGKLSGTD